MIVFKETVLERIEQSFQILFKPKNLFSIVFPIFILNFWFFLCGTYLQNIALWWALDDIKSWGIESWVNLWSLLSDSSIILNISIYTTLLLVYYIIFTFLYLWAVEATKNSIYETEHSDIYEYIKYGINNFWKSMYTYYYYFIYVFWGLAGVFIVAGIVMILWLQNGGKDSSIFHIGAVVGTLWFVIVWFFSFYRSLRATFFLISAVDKESYSKENFEYATTPSKGNIWRILWNFLLLSITIWLISSIFWSVTSGIVSTALWWAQDQAGISTLISSMAENSIGWNQLWENPTDMTKTIENMINSMEKPTLSPLVIVNGFISEFTSSITLWMVLIFTFILFKRLEEETQKKEETPTQVSSPNQTNML